MTVKVYGKARNCIQCDRTKVALDKRDIPYEFVDVTLDMEALGYITNTLGYQQVPVVEYKDEHWSGYRPDKIKGITPREGSMNNYRHELIEAKRSEGIYGLILAIAFAVFALDEGGWWSAFDVILAILFVAIAIRDFRRAKQIKKEA